MRPQFSVHLKVMLVLLFCPVSCHFSCTCNKAVAILDINCLVICEVIQFWVNTGDFWLISVVFLTVTLIILHKWIITFFSVMSVLLCRSALGGLRPSEPSTVSALEKETCLSQASFHAWWFLSSQYRIGMLKLKFLLQLCHIQRLHMENALSKALLLSTKHWNATARYLYISEVCLHQRKSECMYSNKQKARCVCACDATKGNAALVETMKPQTRN